MRLTLFLAIAALVAAANARADEELPFDAHVVPAEAEVYSNAEEPRYVTLTIPRGTKVEVYERRDEWLGIRPPEGSYGWVPSASMTMSQEPGVAAAAADGVACWIGSSAERVREHQSAVQLKKGERVEVLGKKEVENAEGQRELWLKIAPPAGEFRWIHASQVSRQAPSAFTDVSRTEPQRRGAGQSGRTSDDGPASRDWTAVSRSSQAADSSSADSQRDIQPAETPASGGSSRRASMVLRDLTPPVRQAAFRADEPAGGVQLAGHQTAGESPATSRPRSPDGFVPRRHSDQRRLPASDRITPATSSAPSGRIAAAPAKRPQPAASSPPITPVEAATDDAAIGQAGISSAQVQRRLEEIDVELSLMVSRDRSQWNLAALKREVQRLVENGATPVDRGEARFMLEKIDRFAEAFGVEDDAADALDLPVGSAVARKAALEAATAPKYDGSGYLAPVRAAKPIAPYALLDQNGNRICYVTPVPGFNLREYENRKIGVFGKRGFMPDVNASHLLAQRVVDLEKQVR